MDGALETLDYLITAGADVDAHDDRSFSERPSVEAALLVALHRGDDLQSAAHAVLDAVAMRLIDAGANINVRNPYQMRPLDFAARLPSLDIFKALTAKGADPSPIPFIGNVVAGERGLRGQRGSHYLQNATQDGRADVLQEAASTGVNLKKVKTLGAVAFPLLAQAAGIGHLALACVRFLLEYGVDVNEVFEMDGSKLTACDATMHFTSGEAHGAADILAALRAAGGKCFHEL